MTLCSSDFSAESVSTIDAITAISLITLDSLKILKKWMLTVPFFGNGYWKLTMTGCYLGKSVLKTYDWNMKFICLLQNTVVLLVCEEEPSHVSTRWHYSIDPCGAPHCDPCRAVYSISIYGSGSMAQQLFRNTVRGPGLKFKTKPILYHVNIYDQGNVLVQVDFEIWNPRCSPWMMCSQKHSFLVFSRRCIAEGGSRIFFSSRFFSTLPSLYQPVTCFFFLFDILWPLNPIFCVVWSSCVSLF